MNAVIPESFLSHARLLEMLSYDPETGEFHWRVNRGGCVPGGLAGAINSKGYWVIMLDGRNFPAHRLAWFYAYSVWPKGQIDHRHGVRTDNRLAELRCADQFQQNGNSKLRVDNACGLKGVCFDKRKSKWRATITRRGRQRHLGYFSSAQEASTAYALAATQAFGEFARLA